MNGPWSLLIALACGALAAHGAAAQSVPPGETTLAVKVDAAGTMLLSKGARNVRTRINGAGTYSVKFVRDVSQCFYTATAAAPGVSSVFAEPRETDPMSVFVSVFMGGESAPAAFYLTVYCPS